MYKCEWCGAEFDKPKMKHLWSRYEINEDDIIICPTCGDDRIHVVWDDSHDNKKEGEEKKNNE